MNRLAPYQLYFPIGILSALLAVGVWFIQDLNWLSAPILMIHSRLISGGFLWSFITGFLMTAVPKMSGGAPANFFEKILGALLLLSAIATSWLVSGDAFYISQMLCVLFIAVFALRRVVSSTKSIPVFFSHVGLALILAFFGAYAHFRGYFFLGLHLYHLGAVLLLILGIGTRFFSFLSGLPSEFEGNSSPVLKWAFHSAGVLTAACLFLAGSGVAAAYLGLTALAGFYLIYIWKIQRHSERPSALRAAMLVVAVTVPAGFLLCFLKPEQFVTWIHLIFIGCFALMTFSVATRVTLAHGAYSLDLEIKSKTLWAFLICLSIAILSRVGYGYADGLTRKSFLHLAATAWFAAILFWCFSFLKRIYTQGPQAKPSC